MRVRVKEFTFCHLLLIRDYIVSMFATNAGQSSAFFCFNAMLKIYDLFTRYITIKHRYPNMILSRRVFKINQERVSVAILKIIAGHNQSHNWLPASCPCLRNSLSFRNL